jgi:hypothetical protein
MKKYLNNNNNNNNCMNKNGLVLIFGVLLLINFVVADANFTCVDNDGGRNYFKSGGVKLIDSDGGTYIPKSTIGKDSSDLCLTDKRLIETYCENNEFLEEYYDCPTNCENGACNKCESIGFRKNKYYCSEEGDYKLQKMVDAEGNWAKCENHYECESNVCIEGECVRPSFIKSAIAWVKNWFN